MFLINPKCSADNVCTSASFRDSALCRGTLNLVAEVQEVQKRYMVQEVHMEKEAKQWITWSVLIRQIKSKISFFSILFDSQNINDTILKKFYTVYNINLTWIRKYCTVVWSGSKQPRSPGAEQPTQVWAVSFAHGCWWPSQPSLDIHGLSRPLVWRLRVWKAVIGPLR